MAGRWRLIVWDGRRRADECERLGAVPEPGDVLRVRLELGGLPKAVRVLCVRPGHRGIPEVTGVVDGPASVEAPAVPAAMPAPPDAVEPKAGPAAEALEDRIRELIDRLQSGSSSASLETLRKELIGSLKKEVEGHVTYLVAKHEDLQARSGRNEERIDKLLRYLGGLERAVRILSEQVGAGRESKGEPEGKADPERDRKLRLLHWVMDENFRIQDEIRRLSGAN